MARPIKSRIVCSKPKINFFSPDIYTQNECILMTVEEYETIRLMDYLGLTQEEAGNFMNVARTTVQSIYEEARKKISDALVNGKQIRIEGGNYTLCSKMSMGKNCNRKNCKRFEKEY